MTEYKEIPLNKIMKGKSQVRTSLVDVDDLIESIRLDGILQPILVQPKGNKYEVVCGYRRYEAAKSVFSPTQTIPCMVLEEPLSTDEATFLGVVENVQRTELNPIEKGEWVLKMLEAGLSFKDIANRIGKAESTVRHWKRVAETATGVRREIEGMSPRQEKAFEAIVKSSGKEVPLKELLEPSDLKAVTLELVGRHTKDRTKQAQITTAVQAYELSMDKTQQMLELMKVTPERPIEDVARYVKESTSLDIFLSGNLAEKLSEISKELNKSMKETVEWVIKKVITDEKIFNLLKEASKKEK